MTVEFDGTFWDEIYRSRSAVWSGEPNDQLIVEVAALVPGTALDVGCGEGADAIWLAERGWQVTAADISAVALERGRAAAANPDIARRVEWLHTDLFATAPPASTYDLVSAQFMHLPPAPRARMFRGLAAAVKPGGTLLIVGHHPSDLETTVRRPPQPELLYTPGEIAALLDPPAWDILVEVARPRNVTDRDGQTVTVHDTVLRARRRA